MFNDPINSECFVCKSQNSLIINYNVGEITCSKCGAVNAEKLIDEQPESRDFKNEYSTFGNQSNRRYGSVINYDYNDELNDIVLLGNKRFPSLCKVLNKRFYRSERSEKNKIMNQIYVILTNLCSNLNIQEKYSEQTKSLLNIMYNNDDLDSKLLNYYVFVALWITLKKDSNYNEKCKSILYLNKKVSLNNNKLNIILEKCKPYYEEIKVNIIKENIESFLKSCKLQDNDYITDTIFEMVDLYNRKIRNIFYGRSSFNIAIGFIYFCIILFKIEFVITHKRSKEQEDEYFSYKNNDVLLKFLKKISQVKIKKIISFKDKLKKNIKYLCFHSNFENIIQPHLTNIENN